MKDNGIILDEGTVLAPVHYCTRSAMQLAVRLAHEHYADDVETIIMYGDDDHIHGYHLTNWQGKNNANVHTQRNIYSFTQ